MSKVGEPETLEQHSKRLSELNSQISVVINRYLQGPSFNLAAVVGILESHKVSLMTFSRVIDDNHAMMKTSNPYSYIG